MPVSLQNLKKKDAGRAIQGRPILEERLKSVIQNEEASLFSSYPCLGSSRTTHSVAYVAVQAEVKPNACDLK